MDESPHQPPAVEAIAGTGYSLSSPAFFGVLITQFLGAFNDNYFKQLVLLSCVAMAAKVGTDLQFLAMIAFALPFCLLSGIGGYLSDRLSKRKVIVLCKVAEIGVMGLSLLILKPGGSTGQTQLLLLIGVLGLMGAQSAIFGPSKYGILPELFKGKTLLPVNGAIQTTTFLAIIFGMTAAGIALDQLENSLWICSIIAIGIAIAGTFTSFWVSKTPVAKPGLRIQPDNLFVPRDVRALLKERPDLIKALLVLALFWFIGGVAQPAVNSLGENALQLNKTRTSLLAACIGVGIASGCAIAGFANRASGKDGARWTTRGSWMIFFSLTLIAVLSSGILGKPVPSAGVTESFPAFLKPSNMAEMNLQLSMLCLGISAGFFVIPVQVYVQQTPPDDVKGRMLGSMNFLTWLGIVASAVFYGVVNLVLELMFGDVAAAQWQFLTFAILALIMLPVAIRWRLPGLSPVQSPPDA